ncbi:MAG TPA: hypothetical protein VFF39_08760 [Verrucomicrobiae bacterium]|nr:hypothetical protein [Verrucomicrobiae bacterium]
MWIIGCDYHPSFQQIAFVDQATGEYGNLRLEHKGGEADRFYRSLAGEQACVGVEATGGMRWFERLLGELGFELWVGDPTKIRAAAARKAKTDKQDGRTVDAFVVGETFSADLGADGGATRCAATDTASAPFGANANAGQEPVAGHR